MDQPIPVICDRCRAEGQAGEEPFAGLGDLLDFEPVPRKARADGWTPGRQREGEEGGEAGWLRASKD